MGYVACSCSVYLVKKVQPPWLGLPQAPCMEPLHTDWTLQPICCSWVNKLLPTIETKPRRPTLSSSLSTTAPLLTMPPPFSPDCSWSHCTISCPHPSLWCLISLPWLLHVAIFYTHKLLCEKNIPACISSDWADLCSQPTRNRQQYRPRYRPSLMVGRHIAYLIRSLRGYRVVPSCRSWLSSVAWASLPVRAQVLCARSYHLEKMVSVSYHR